MPIATSSQKHREAQHQLPNISTSPIHSTTSNSTQESHTFHTSTCTTSSISSSNNQSTNPHKEYLSMLVINFQSITNKGTELYNIIASSLPNIIIGTESHLDPNYNSAEILPHGIPKEHQYNTYRKDRKELINKNGGGVIILVGPDIKADECNDLNTD
ncbi:hypothetical protein ACJMK2_033581 [Sinanodonta woodiana]|uniref:Uncharacterized protein n=1 Tax=Sinanodonta woodiana TaxID=1069815 RepID=A0ABD3WQN8_SINWO